MDRSHDVECAGYSGSHDSPHDDHVTPSSPCSRLLSGLWPAPSDVFSPPPPFSGTAPERRAHSPSTPHTSHPTLITPYTPHTLCPSHPTPLTHSTAHTLHTLHTSHPPHLIPSALQPSYHPSLTSSAFSSFTHHTCHSSQPPPLPSSHLHTSHPPPHTLHPSHPLPTLPPLPLTS